MQEDQKRTPEFEIMAMLLPVKIIAFAAIILAGVALIFEVVSASPMGVYAARMAVIVISIAVLALINTEFGKKSIPVLAHILIFSIVISLGYNVFKVPGKFTVELSAGAALLLVFGISVGWNIVNQLAAVVYTILIFTVAVFMNSELLGSLSSLAEPGAFFTVLVIISLFAARMRYGFIKGIDRRLSEPITPVSEVSVQSLTADEKFKSIIDNLPEGIFKTTIDGRIIYANDALAKILGYENAEELMQSNVAEDMYADDEERAGLIKVLSAQKKIKNYRIRLNKKDNEQIIAKVSEKLICDENEKPLYMEGVLQDITQQAKLEEERKSELNELRSEKKKALKDINKAVYTSNIKAQFLASMTHEIKTPINSIVGFLTLIEKGMFESEGELKDFAKNAKTAADSLLDIINNMLDISKIEAGKMELDTVGLNLKEELEKAISMIKPLAAEKKLELNFEYDDEIPEGLFGDPTRFRQIALNVLSNAVKYTDKGEIRIIVDLTKQTEATAKIKTTIIDTGRGIPEEKLSLLFKPYTQIKAKRWTQKDGAGLGLMISKEFVNLMGGDIIISSDEGIGTTVEFAVIMATKKEFLKKLKKEEKKEPAEEIVEEVIDELETNGKVKFEFGVEEEKTKTEPEKKIEEPEVKETIEVKEVAEKEIDEQNDDDNDELIPEHDSGKKKRLLLVEDNPISQKVEKKLLTDSGYDVEAVSSALDAIEAVKTNSFDLILMDVEMPDMDGLTATQKIRELEAPSGSVPIIAVTAHSSMKDREKCLAAGMDDYIAKPININFMKMTIDQWLYRNF